MAEEPSLVELSVASHCESVIREIVGQAHRLPRQPGGCTSCTRCAEGTMRRRLQLAQKKGTESKAHKRPNLPCAWYFALYRFAKRESVSLPNLIAHGTRLPRHPKIKEITNSTRNIKNRSFAMPADAAAIPPNPKTAATSAMIRKTTAHPNISSPPQRLNRICRLARVPLHACSRLDIRNDLNELPQPETSLSREQH